MKALLDGLKGLGPARLAAMGAVALGMLGMLALLALHGSGGGDRMALLYGDLDLREAGQITDQLDKAHIAHQEQGQGTTILVNEADVARSRLLLAKGGLPSGGSIGYEIFDRGDELTASDFQQRINETRALEGEIARSIRMLDGVRGARVHLVLPQREPFSREQQEAQASVVLTMAGGARLDREGVQAVLNLIAAAVPGLRPQNIAIIDTRGELLARAGAPTGTAGEVQSTEELRQATELRLSHAVEEMLESSIGPGRVRAEAAVEMNFDQVRETDESYNPDQQVVRSTQTSSDNSKTTDANKTVTVQNNLPNADAGQTQSGTQDQRQEETTNYEIGKTVRTLVHAEPQISRISLAVMVDGIESPGPDGRLIWKERSPEELARIATLVRSAIGYDAKRGDKVEVVNMRFVMPEEEQVPLLPARGLFGVSLGGPQLISLAQTGILGIVALLALLFVLRPMVMRITALPGVQAIGEAAALALPQPGFAVAGGPPALVTASGVPALSGGSVPLQAMLPSGTAGLLADESMVNLANIEGQMRASSLRRLGDLVERHPEETLAIMRGWMAQETR